MSTLLIQIFGAMSVTFLFGLILGWLLWKFATNKGEDGGEFWKGKFEQSRGEFFTEQTAHQKLQEEYDLLKQRFSKAEKTS